MVKTRAEIIVLCSTYEDVMEDYLLNQNHTLFAELDTVKQKVQV